MSTTCCGTAKFNVLTKECKTGSKFLHFKFNFALCLFKKTDEKGDCACCVKWKCVGGKCADQEIVCCKPSELDTHCASG